MVTDYIRSRVKNDTVYPGLSTSFWSQAKKDEKFNTRVSYKEIPGLKEAGFTDKDMQELINKPKGTSFQKSCERILELLKNHKSAWPFKEPVKREEVPDYYDVIKNPIDLSKIS